MNYHQAKYFPEYKGTDLITFKCRECGELTTRTIHGLRKTFGKGKKPICKDCSIKKVDRNYKFVEKLYEIKKISKSLK